MTPTRIPLRCACCHLPYAELQRDATGRWTLIIISRHNGQHHTNTLSVVGLEALLRGETIHALTDVVT